MTSSTYRPAGTALLLFLLFQALYGLTSSGNAFRVPDEFEVYFQIEQTSIRTLLVAVTMTAALGAQSTPAPAALPKEVAALQGAWTVTLFNDLDPGGALDLQFEAPNTRW